MSVLSDQKLHEVYMEALMETHEKPLEESRTCALRAVAEAAVAADRAARAEPVAHVWLQPQDLPWMIESLKMARLLVKREPRNEEIEKVQHALEVELMNLPSAPPAAPVVPDDFARDAERYRWIRRKTHCRIGTVFSFPAINTLAGVRPGQKTYAERFDACIDEAMLAAAPAPSQEPKQ